MIFISSAETSWAEPGKALTLSGAFKLALKRNESLAIQKEEIEEAQGRFRRALGVWLPNVKFRMTRFEQDVSGEGASSDGISSDSRRRVKPESKFVFSQPLFSGFKEFAALKAAGADRKQQEKEYERARELLFVDVVEAYYNAIGARRDAEIFEGIRRALSDRLKDLESRVKLGRSRESELKASEADLKLAEADLIGARSSEALAKNLLEFYIGENLNTRTLLDEAAEIKLSDISTYLSRAQSRKDVEALLSGKILAEGNVVSAQSGLFPKLTLDGNYYTHRVGFQNGNDWDVLLTLDVPIFDGAQTLGNIKEAAARKDIADLKYEESKRLAERELRDAYEALLSSLQAESALKAANDASKENYDIQVKEYRLNLVNNLDVLDTLRRSEDIERRYNEAHIEARKNYWKFKAALGEIEGVSS